MRGYGTIPAARQQQILYLNWEVHSAADFDSSSWILLGPALEASGVTYHTYASAWSWDGLS